MDASDATLPSFNTSGLLCYKSGHYSTEEEVGHFSYTQFSLELSSIIRFTQIGYSRVIEDSSNLGLILESQL